MMNEAQRHDAAELMRQGVVTIATRNLGARTEEEVRWALEMTAAGCQAELEAAAPSPLPAPPNRTGRRARQPTRQAVRSLATVLRQLVPRTSPVHR